MYEADKTKKCPFCAETILAEAVKCRHCAEFLFDSRNSSPRPQLPIANQIYDDDEQEDFSFHTGPSLIAGFGTYLRSMIIIAIAIAIMVLPITDYMEKLLGDDLAISENNLVNIKFYINLGGIALIALAFLGSLWKIVQLKAISYEVSPDRIEWSRGIFNRKIDNLDMFRIIDIKLHRTIVDCMLGIGTVTIMTKDETDPQFHFSKVSSPKKLYDVLKGAYLNADRKQGVIHIE